MKLLLRILGGLIVVGLLYIAFSYYAFRYNDCIMVGHSETYCMMDLFTN